MTLLALVGCITLYLTHRPPRIAYVNSTRLLSDFQGMVEARRTYHRQQQEWQRNFDTLQAETARSIQEYRKKRPSLTSAQRVESETALRVRQKQLGEYQLAIQGQDREAQEKLTRTVVDSTNAFLKQYGQQHNYDLIFLTAEGDNIAYSKNGFDITVPVLVELNAQQSTNK
ncbi:OmpH/Skp family outer membrane protein [Hymenobacter segetis]|uniref:OmpH family outer membrane protein n=1 Tax=Hymenobacter segetis TaxID=2025509 RepID=UPI00313E7CE5